MDFSGLDISLIRYIFDYQNNKGFEEHREEEQVNIE